MEKEVRDLIDREKAKLQVDFNRSDGVVVKENSNIQKKPDDMVDQVFEAAKAHAIQTSDKLKSKMLDTANKYVDTKMNVIESKVVKEDKEAFFDSNTSACECFGYDEKDTPKWAVALMSKWHDVMTFLWILAGILTFAPITFVAKKISVIFKKTWLATLIAVIIYIVVITAPFIPVLINIIK